jgi:hypothetical protein
MRWHSSRNIYHEKDLKSPAERKMEFIELKNAKHARIF